MTHPLRPAVRLLALILVWVPVAPAFSTPAGGESADQGSMHSITVLGLVDDSAEPVTTVWRQAVARGLAAAAGREKVVLCPPKQSRPECSPEVLAEAPELHWSISTSVTVQHSLALIRIPLTLKVAAGGSVIPPEPGLFVIEENIVLPVGTTDEERDPLLAHRVGGVLGNYTAVMKWFSEVRATPGLTRTVLLPAVKEEAPASEAATHDQTPPAAPKPVAIADWRNQEEQILALLIDDRFADARHAADRLLDEDELPAAERERVLRLRETALKREAVAKENEEAPIEAPATAPEKPFDYTFTVRVAAPGRGFLKGTEGRLRVYDGGVRFVPASEEGDSREESDGFFLRWSELRSWGEAEGLWDISHPLELTPVEGDSIYLALIDHEGRFHSGARILSLLSRGAERARNR